MIRQRDPKRLRLIQGASLSRARAFGHFGFGVGFRPKVTVAFYRPCPEQEGSRYTPTHVRVERESRGQARKRVCGTHPRTHTRTHTHTHTHTRMHAHTHAHGMLGSQHPLPHCKHLRFIFSASITHSVVYTLFQWNHFLGFRGNAHQDDACAHPGNVPCVQVRHPQQFATLRDCRVSSAQMQARACLRRVQRAPPASCPVASRCPLSLLLYGATQMCGCVLERERERERKYVFMYVRMYVCMYVNTHTHTHT